MALSLEGNDASEMEYSQDTVPSFPAVHAGESDSSGQLVGSVPQPTGKVNMKGRVYISPTPWIGTMQLCGRLPKSQGATMGGGGSPPSSPDRGAQDSDGYTTASEFTSRHHQHRVTEGVEKGSSWYL